MINLLIRFLLWMMVRIEGRENLQKLPDKGPALVVMNHINFLEAPLFYFLYKPRPIWALAKTELWHHPFFGIFVRKWGGIAVARGGSNRSTFDLVKSLMDKGEMVAIAPEGTRSGTGILGRGKPGIAVLAQQTGVPVIPVAHWGGQDFWKNLRSFRRTTIHIRVGDAFLPNAAEGKSARQEVTDQVMQHLARLLPPELQGVYREGL